MVSVEIIGKLPLFLVKLGLKAFRRSINKYNAVNPPTEWNIQSIQGQMIEKEEWHEIAFDDYLLSINAIQDNFIYKLTFTSKKRSSPKFWSLIKNDDLNKMNLKKDKLVSKDNETEFQIDERRFSVICRENTFISDLTLKNTEKWMQIQIEVDPNNLIYGLGENTSSLEKTNTTTSFWNTDSIAYSRKFDHLYQSQPILIGIGNNLCYSIIYDNPQRSQIKTEKKEDTIQIQYFIESNNADLLLVVAPDINILYQKLADVLGKSPLPPISVLGNHQSKWSYYPEEDVRNLANTFRTKKIPCDFIHLDIDYMDNYKIFTWDREKFPTPPKMISDLNSQGFHIMAMTDPGIKIEPEYELYAEGIKDNHFILDQDGKPYVGKVWPGPCHFPDFVQSKTRDWFGSHFNKLTEVGVRAFWIDMNDPSLFNSSGTIPDDAIHPAEGKNLQHKDIHNLYGHLMAKSVYQGLTKLLPNKRIFILTRSAFLSTQKYAGSWTGDNISEWNHLRLCIPMLLNMSLSGQVIIGPDIGGFVGKPSGELLARWYQAAILFPFYRNHTIKNCSQEPWLYGEEHEKVIRETIQLRYKFLPYIYTVIRETCLSGIPAMRPLWYNSIIDREAHKQQWAETEYVLGNQIIVAPIMEKGAEEREIYLPEGTWHMFNERIYEGKQVHTIQAPLSVIPIFIKEGSIIPMITKEIQNTEEMLNSEIDLLIVGKNYAEGEIYLDDGQSKAFEKGEYEYIKIKAQKQNANTWHIKLEREGKKKQFVNIGKLNFLGKDKVNYIIFDK